jgi:hypothetical protein
VARCSPLYLEWIDHLIHSAAGVRCCGGTDPLGHGLSATIPAAPEAAVLIGGLGGEWDRGRRTLVEGKIERRAGGPLVERPQLMSKSGSAMPGQSGSRSKCRGRSLAGAGTASAPIIMRANHSGWVVNLDYSRDSGMRLPVSA